MIGAGIGQLFLARKIKKRGDYLIVVTMPGSFPVIELANKVCYVNVFDKEKVLQVAIENQVDAVVSDQNDTMMPTVSYVAENLGLPGNHTTIINAYCNKNIFRDNCDKLGIPVPKHCAVTDTSIPAEAMLWGFPWMIKPADSQSSLGVAKVNNVREYEAAIQAALEVSKTKTAIVEEFFVGQELVAEGFIYHGKYYNLGFADRKYFDLNDLFIPSQTIFPSSAPVEVQRRIVEYECAMAKYNNPEFAIVHAEYLYNPENGEIRVVESALRGGGVFISSHLVPLYSGIDINEILLDCIIGKEVNMESVMQKKQPKAAGYVCFYLPEGKIETIDGIEKVKALPCVHICDLSDVKVGMDSPVLTHKGQRLGPILVSGENRDDIEMNIRQIQNLLSIQIRNSDGELNGINWK